MHSKLSDEILNKIKNLGYMTALNIHLYYQIANTLLIVLSFQVLMAQGMTFGK